MQPRKSRDNEDVPVLEKCIDACAHGTGYILATSHSSCQGPPGETGLPLDPTPDSGLVQTRKQVCSLVLLLLRCAVDAGDQGVVTMVWLERELFLWLHAIFSQSVNLHGEDRFRSGRGIYTICLD